MEAEGVVETARTQLGRAYRWGGESPDTGFDCSGLVQWVFGQHGVSLPRRTAEQVHAGTSVSRKDLRPGDLLFYALGKSKSRPDHVGIYAGDGKFIHSPRTGKHVMLSPAFNRYFAARFRGARRVEAPGRVQAASAESASGVPRYYVVKRGDYVWKIARELGVSPHELLRTSGLNRDDVLRVGQRLRVPD